MSCRVTSRPKHFLHFRFFCNRPTSPFVIFFILSSFVKYIYIYILGVARYTDVTVRYVPRFGGHGSIQFRYNRKKKKSTMLGFFSFILNRQ